MNDVLIIGAGIAGLTAASTLQAAGREVLVLEKSRGYGGRSATRTLAGNRIDHGAQYFTARDERFQAQVSQWLEQGQARVWARGFHTLRADGSIAAASQGQPRYIFPQGMNTIGKLLAQGLEVKRETRVTAIQALSEGWEISLDGDETIRARAVVVTTPAEQALQLCHSLELDKGLRQALNRITMTPCFALMLVYPAEHRPTWQGLFIEGDEVLSWLAHDSSKREEPENTVLVAHASPGFSQQHFEAADRAQKIMLERLREIGIGAWTEQPLASSLQRWRYALAQSPLEQGYLGADGGLYFCGDWCQGNRVEGAYLSGLAVAGAISQ